jgi:hypothetical protein
MKITIAKLGTTLESNPSFCPYGKAHLEEVGGEDCVIGMIDDTPNAITDILTTFGVSMSQDDGITFLSLDELVKAQTAIDYASSDDSGMLQDDDQDDAAGTAALLHVAIETLGVPRLQDDAREFVIADLKEAMAQAV